MANVLPTILRLIANATISHVDLVYDYDPGPAPLQGHLNLWFDVSLELTDTDQGIQTVEFTVTYDPEHKQLNTILGEMGWAATIRHRDNESGQYFDVAPDAEHDPQLAYTRATIAYMESQGMVRKDENGGYHLNRN